VGGLEAPDFATEKTGIVRMTFYEAALRVLEEAGAPLHYLEITKRSLDKGLFSHIG
jgi:hypothetical protein